MPDFIAVSLKKLAGKAAHYPYKPQLQQVLIWPSNHFCHILVVAPAPPGLDPFSMTGATSFFTASFPTAAPNFNPHIMR
jgi:hypothetical protein